MSLATPSSYEIDTSKDNIYSTSILIASLSSPSDYHVLESAIRNATRSTKDRLIVILHSPAFEGNSHVNWFELQRLLTWTYVESTAVAQDMDKVLLDTDVLLRPQPLLAMEGNSEDEELVEEADAVYLFKDGAPQIPFRSFTPPTEFFGLRLGHILMVDLEILQPRIHPQTRILERITYSSPTRRR